MVRKPSTIAEDLQQLWKQCPKRYRVTIDKKRTLVGQQRRNRERENREQELPVLRNWALILDNVLSWFAAEAAVFYIEFLNKRRSPDIEFGSFLIVLSAILNHGIAVRKLVMDGFDLPAKTGLEINDRVRGLAYVV